MELVVGQTADSVLVCIADPTTKRVTGLDYTVAEEKWATLAEPPGARQGDQGPAAAVATARPTGRDDRPADRPVRDLRRAGQPGVRAGNLMAALIALNAPGRVIWKQPITSDRFGEAKLHGFSTFGYVLNDRCTSGTTCDGWPSRTTST